MSGKLSLPLLYDYSKEVLNVYSFSTVNGVKHML